MVVRRPQCLSLEETTQTLVSLRRLIVSCKLLDVGAWLLRCLLALTQFYVETTGDCRRQSTEHSDTGLSRDEWTSIYADCLRYLLCTSQQFWLVHILECLVFIRIDVGHWYLSCLFSQIMHTSAFYCQGLVQLFIFFNKLKSKMKFNLECEVQYI